VRLLYRARDPKLGHDVAIKVLPEAFACDAERMTRFQCEAKALASLDHPNIASIYGLEDSGGTRALVMQFVEGPTLADRIRQGAFKEMMPGQNSGVRTHARAALSMLNQLCFCL
jgi:eukaryotic-like serine/threonine-protein kinase